jgi:undecaprenyl phosphate-alpha-L-ara4FN deformylase
MKPVIALKVDVDTERGTREGVPALMRLLELHGVPATFLFSLGPDNTGKAISRIFRPGFFKKVSRTSVVQTYGVRTLLNGTFLPAPHIGKRHGDLLRSVHETGFEVGIHCYDHYHWQDHLFRLSPEQTRAEFNKARREFIRIFGFEARAAGAPGWQATLASKQVYDDAELHYASDCRGESPFFPRIGEHTFKTPEIPTTLPTLDELLGHPEFPDESIVPHYVGLLRRDRPNVLTIHAEIEGGPKQAMFSDFIRSSQAEGFSFVKMEELADEILERPEAIPVSELEMASIAGRSGNVATQVCTAA